MSWIFLDDIRNVSDIYPALTNDDFVVIRSYDDFIDHIISNGLPEFISFDNDLGEDLYGNVLLDGYACAKWLVYQSGLDLRKFKYKVHSANPVASLQIKSLLDNYIDFLKSDPPLPPESFRVVK